MMAPSRMASRSSDDWLYFPVRLVEAGLAPDAPMDRLGKEYINSFHANERQTEKSRI